MCTLQNLKYSIETKKSSFDWDVYDAGQLVYKNALMYRGTFDPEEDKKKAKEA